MTAGRTGRDWAVDTVVFGLAVCIGLFSLAERLASYPASLPPGLLALDLAVGGLACLALWVRRRRPVVLAVALVVVSSFSDMVSGAMLVMLFTVAVHERPRVTGTVFAVSLVGIGGYVLLRPDAELSPVSVAVFAVVVEAAVVGWGLFVHHRRQLLASLRERAERAESEARLRAERAQRQARDDIAREMHDVLGHRLSLLSVHAGALQYRPDADPAAVAQAAAVIRDNAHRALDDLRVVIGVLRAPTGELSQPRLCDLPELVAESRRAGMSVTVRQEVIEAPEHLGRDVYRIVQEGLTNARKHAPDAVVTVTVTGEPGDRLRVEVADTGPATGSATEDGRGLVGLAERVAVAGGTIRHGPDPDGGWRLAASLPWPA